MIANVLIVIFLIILILTIHSMKLLRKELLFLPGINEILFLEDTIVGTNIFDVLGDIKLAPKHKTTILLLSPHCEMCREKLETISKNKKINKEKYLFYADTLKQQEFNEFCESFKDVPIQPLTAQQIQKLNKGFYPFFIDVEPNGKIIKTYLK